MPNMSIDVPDFAQIARTIPAMSCEACTAKMRRAADGLHYDDARGGSTWGACRTVVADTRIAAQLRKVWNARGAADAKAIDAETHRVAGEANRTGRTDLEIDLVTALKKLDC